ncbi:MAG: polyprenyl synthetase family protein [Bacteroidota bacterium]
MLNLRQLQALFSQYMSENPFKDEPSELYVPVDYIMNLGGKRLRPILLLMSYNLFDDQVKRALPAAYAIEIFHNFSLVHDDIMDDAPLRRGKPTVHVKYGRDAGILCGDLMLSSAYEFLTQVQPAELIPHLIRILNRLSIGVCKGQQYDMNFETAQEVEIDDYLNMIALKTSVLIAGAMEMGALIAGASEVASKHLYEFGKNIGIAFQLQDDILDTFGDPKKFGKRVGGDIIQNKKTYLLLKALELAQGELQEELRHILSTPDIAAKTKVEAVTAIYERLEVRKDAEKIKEQYQQKAFDHLASVEVPAERKQLLTELAQSLMRREI